MRNSSSPRKFSPRKKDFHSKADHFSPSPRRNNEDASTQENNFNKPRRSFSKPFDRKPPFKRTTNHHEDASTQENNFNRPRRSFSKPFDRKSPFKRTTNHNEDNPQQENNFNRPRRSFSKPFDRKPPFKRTTNHHEDNPQQENNFNRPRRSFSKPFDRKPPFKRTTNHHEDNPQQENNFNRPRRNFSKPFDRKPPFKRTTNHNEDNPQQENNFNRPRRSFSKPFDRKSPFKRTTNHHEDASTQENNFNRPRRNFSKPFDRKPPFKRTTNHHEDASTQENNFNRPRRNFSKPFDRKPPFKRTTNHHEDNPQQENNFNKPRRAFIKPAFKRTFNKRTKGEIPRNERQGKRVLHPQEIPQHHNDDHIMPERDAPPIERVSPFPMPLNKYLAYCEVGSRRLCADIVKKESVMINGELIKEPGIRVAEQDVVSLNGKTLRIQHKLVYILLNKPKGFICSKADERERKTIYELVHCPDIEQMHSIGRLDKDTTGLILITNDGELTQQLSHPTFEVNKIYKVTLNRPLSPKDYEAIRNGITLEDGLIAVDELAYTNPLNKAELGIALHSGRNRIVRRIFEHLGYEVTLLDRVTFAGLTKKGLERGTWRYLSAAEVRNLKYFNRKAPLDTIPHAPENEQED